MRKLLITGFDPFGGESTNPSWEAVRKLPDIVGNFALCKLQIPTVFGLAAEKVLEAAHAFQPDVILCHHLYFLAALVREQYPEIPVYGQCHGSDLRQIRKNPWMRDWIAENIRKLDGIFALHAQQKQTILETFGIAPEKVSVMGTGYNSDVFFLNPEAKAQKCDSKTRLIFAGKLSEKKGTLQAASGAAASA